jgi:hypothetical protein
VATKNEKKKEKKMYNYITRKIVIKKGDTEMGWGFLGEGAKDDLSPVAERHNGKEEEDASHPHHQNDHHDHRVAVALFY